MLPLIVSTLVFLGVGLVTTFWPRRVQQFAVWLYEKIGFWPYAALAQRIKRELYVTQLRIIGFVCWPVGLLCAWLLWIGRT
jgi:hypothetical protein